jgi:hypothetical protein
MKVRISEELLRVRVDKKDTLLLEQGHPISCSIMIGNGTALSFILSAAQSAVDNPSIQVTETRTLITVPADQLKDLLSGNISTIFRDRSDDGCTITVEIDIQ